MIGENDISEVTKGKLEAVKELETIMWNEFHNLLIQSTIKDYEIRIREQIKEQPS